MGSTCSASNLCERHIDMKHCHADETIIPRRSRSRKDSTIDSIDDFYNLLNSVSQKNWVKEESFICEDKFFSYYKGYLRDQAQVSEIWNSVIIEDGSPRGSENPSSLQHIKSLIRTGVPLDNVRTLVLDIFKKTYSANEIEYDCALKVAFPAGVPEGFKNVPLFSYSHQIEDVLVVHFLNDRGLEAFKRIMWVYERNVPMLEYSPLLPQVVALLLLFLTEDETYCVVKEMLETSEKLLDVHKTKNGLKSLKWHFTLTKDQFEVFLESLSSFLKDRSNNLLNLWKHFHKINYDCNDLFWQLMKSLFLGYLPLATTLKIFTAYLNEGIKIYGRFALALLKLFETDILLCTSSENVLSVVKERCSKITKAEIQTLVTTAYSLRLGQLKQRIPTIQPQTFHAPESSKIYFPQLSDPSLIISTPHFETIWEWLPFEWKITNPTLAYCSKIHGWSLHTLYMRLREMESYKGILILIKTVDSVTLGAFVDGMIESEIKTTSIGTDESFVFQLEPEEKRYQSTKNNDVHMICDRDFLSVGGGSEGPAIYLSNDLLYGYSYRSETYDNEPLNQTNGKQHTHFECYAVEVYWVD